MAQCYDMSGMLSKEQNQHSPYVKKECSEDMLHLMIGEHGISNLTLYVQRLS